MAIENKEKSRANLGLGEWNLRYLIQGMEGSGRIPGIVRKKEKSSRLGLSRGVEIGVISIAGVCMG
jgi:hypothetical protein